MKYRDKNTLSFFFLCFFLAIAIRFLAHIWTRQNPRVDLAKFIHYVTTFFSIVRGLANLPLPQLKEGGLGWVTDLTAADPYYILPATSLLFTNLVFKVSMSIPILQPLY